MIATTKKLYTLQYEENIKKNYNNLTKLNYNTMYKPNKLRFTFFPTTVACRSHSAFSFVHSTMTTGCDATRRADRRCQPRLVL